MDYSTSPAVRHRSTRSSIHAAATLARVCGDVELIVHENHAYSSRKGLVTANFELEGQGVLNRSPTDRGKAPCGGVTTVDEFVAAGAPSFNKFQQTSTIGRQTIQHESLRNNKNP